MPRVTLYGKPGCHLCEDARAVVERVRAAQAFELEEVDVSLDPVLHRRYGERIPVVEVDGEVLFELVVDEGSLSDACRARSDACRARAPGRAGREAMP